MRRISLWPVLALCALALISARSDAQATPRTILARGENLAESKRRLAKGDAGLKASYDALVSSAGKALAAEPMSVMQKKRTPSSGTKHDYMSMAPYYWPDTTKPNGLPFLSRDGEMYPESRLDHDGLRMQQTIARAKTLSYAWYFTGDVRYAEGAAKILRIFFLDSATRMNPNLQFAQAIMGVSEGRSFGLIDSRTVPDLVDAVRILEDSPAWTRQDDAVMTSWCRQFMTWMLESKNGREERATTNNHGVFYDEQVASLALFVGDSAIAREILGTSARARIASQIDSAGKQQRELARTRPLHYTLFNIEAFTMLAELARHVDGDLWHYAANTGGSIERAIRFAAPYADSRLVFPSKDITPVGADAFLVPLRRAAAAYHDRELSHDVEQLPMTLRTSDLSRFEFPDQP